MADKYLKHDGQGGFAEQEATVNGGTSTQAGDIIALDAAGRITNSILPTGIGADTVVVEASEALSTGDFVNIFNDSGTAKARKANATSAGKPANGFVLEAVNSGSDATIYTAGTNTGQTGLTVGPVYLSAQTGGGVSTSTPSASGNFVQLLGFAFEAGKINFVQFPGITLA